MRKADPAGPVEARHHERQRRPARPTARRRPRHRPRTGWHRPPRRRPAGSRRGGPAHRPRIAAAEDHRDGQDHGRDRAVIGERDRRREDVAEPVDRQLDHDRVERGKRSAQRGRDRQGEVRRPGPVERPRDEPRRLVWHGREGPPSAEPDDHQDRPGTDERDAVEFARARPGGHEQAERGERLADLAATDEPRCDGQGREVDRRARRRPDGRTAPRRRRHRPPSRKPGRRATRSQPRRGTPSRSEARGPSGLANRGSGARRAG